MSVRVVPDASTFTKDLRAKIVPQAAAIGQEVGKAISAGIKKGLGDPLSGPLDESSKKQRTKAPKQGEEVAGAFAEGFSKRLKAAFEALPKAKITADSSDADRKVAELRAQLKELSTKRIGIDIEPGDALAKIAAIKAELDKLGKSADIQVRADAAEAAAKLAEIGAEAKKLNDEHPKIKVDAETAKAIADLVAADEEAKKLADRKAKVEVEADTSGAMSGIASISIALGALAAIPVAAPLVAGIGAMVPALGAAGAGFGALGAVALPAISQIKNAIAAQNQVTGQSVQLGLQAQQRALAMAGAQQQLAAAVRNEAYTHQMALQQVGNAETQLAQSQVSAREAQISLTEARLAETQRLQDLKNSLIDTGLSIGQDRINVEKARLAMQQFNSVQADGLAIARAQQQLALAQSGAQQTLADPNATAAQKAQAQIIVAAAQTALRSAQQQQKADNLAREQAKIAYEQAIQQLKEEQLAYQRLQQTQAKANKQGVEGSDQVRKAREALVAANNQVANSEQALANARANVYRSDRQSADAVTAAQRGLRQAQLQSASSNSTLANAMAKLSPAARVLMGQWLGLTHAFQGWSRSLQPAVLPLFGRGIDLLRQSLPYLTPVVLGATHAVNGLITGVQNGARSPFWTQFRVQMTQLVPVAITGLGRAAGNVATGIAGIVKAFIPFAPIVLGFLDKITAGFARWGKGLGSSSAFTSFMGFVRRVAPLVEHDIVLIAGAVAHVVASLAPLGPLGLSSIGLLARLVKGLSPGEIQAIAFAFIAVKAAMAAAALGTAAWTAVTKIAAAAQKIWTVIVWLWNAAMDANVISIVVIAIAALIVGVIYAYTHFRTFHQVVQTVFKAIGAIVSLYWNFYLKPILTTLTFLITNVVIPALLWLWRSVFVPMFKAIGLIVSLWWNLWMKPVFTALWAIIKNVIGPVFLWLWKAIINVAMNEIKIIVGLAWALVIRPVFVAINFYIRNVLAPTITWLWQTIIKPVWNQIGNLISWVWTNLIRPTFNNLKEALGEVGNAFAVAAGAIKTAWDRIEGYTKAPVSFVINTVYNGGIVGLWNQVMKWLQVPITLSPFHAPGFAAGGPLPVAPGIFNKPTAIVGEGNPNHPEYVIPTDPKYRTRAAGLWQAAGSDLQMLAGGGILGGIGNVIGEVKKIAGSVVNLGADALKLITNPKSVWDALVTKLVPSVAGLKTSAWGDAVADVPPKILGALWTEADKIITTFSSAFGGAGGKAMADLALTQVGYHEGAGNANKYTQGLGRGHGEAWCFAAGTLVDTPDGLKPIEEVAPGTEVCTPSGDVIRTSHLLTRRKALLRLTALGVPDTATTEDHPYWAMRRTSSPKARRRLSGPQWVKVGELKRGDMIALPIPADGKEPFDPDLAYVYGMYLADGHRLHKASALGVQFSDDASERERIVAALKRAGYDDVRVAENRTCMQFTVYERGLYEACGRFGDLAHGKRLPGEAFGWERSARQAFLDGYVAGDGTYDEANGYRATTVSRILAHDLGKLVRSLGHVPNIQMVRPAGTMVIEGREVQTRDTYALKWKTRPNARPQSFERDGQLWVPIRSITETGRVETVYDLTVPGEHAFIADGAHVSNCADFIDWLAANVTPSQSAAIPQTASAPGMARGFGSRFRSGSSGIQVGDIAFFDEGQGSIVHTGIAVSANTGGTWTSVEGNYGDQVAKNRRSEAAGYATPDYKGGTTGSFPGGSLIHASPAAAQAWAGQALVGHGHGWGGQFGDLKNLWNRESGWRWSAENPTSGAYGIPQALPASKMGVVAKGGGPDWHDNAATQIRWGLDYIDSRYGSPAAAWGHEISSGWYDEGGLLPTGPSLVYNGTGESEFVFRKDQLDGLLNGSSGGYHNEYHAHFDGATKSSIQSEVRTGFYTMEIANARRERIGRRS